MKFERAGGDAVQLPKLRHEAGKVGIGHRREVPLPPLLDLASRREQVLQMVFPPGAGASAGGAVALAGVNPELKARINAMYHDMAASEDQPGLVGWLKIEPLRSADFTAGWVYVFGVDPKCLEGGTP